MIKDKSPQSSKKALDNLYDFLQGPELDVRTFSIDEVSKELKEEKIDVTPLLTFVQKRLASERLRIARDKRAKIDAFISLHNRNASGGDGLRERILKLLSGKPEMAIAYRKFVEASDDDLEGLLEDLEISKILDDLHE